MLPKETLKNLEESQAKIAQGLEEKLPSIQKSLDIFAQLSKDFQAAEKRVARRLRHGIRKTSDFPL